MGSYALTLKVEVLHPNNEIMTAGRFHDVFGTLNGRMFTDGSLLYGCTCNMSVSFTACPLRFDEDFRTAAFEDVDFCYRWSLIPNTTIQVYCLL